MFISNSYSVKDVIRRILFYIMVAWTMNSFTQVSAQPLPVQPELSSEKAFALSPSEFQKFDTPYPQAPTPKRPYHYMKFDGTTLDRFEGGPAEAFALSYKFMTVINFIDESSPYSAMHNQVLDRTLAAIAPESENKDIMRIDVVVRDAQRQTVYGSAFRAFYEDNRLGPDFTNRDQLMLPYGIVFGDELAEGRGNLLYDFSLINGAKTSADLNANADAIAGTLLALITAYNEKQ